MDNKESKFILKNASRTSHIYIASTLFLDVKLMWTNSFFIMQKSWRWKALSSGSSHEAVRTL